MPLDSWAFFVAHQLWGKQGKFPCLLKVLSWRAEAPHLSGTIRNLEFHGFISWFGLEGTLSPSGPTPHSEQ